MAKAYNSRFLAALGCELLELGPVNATIHKVNERVAVDELSTLTGLYEQILVQLLGAAAA